jgi:hypothetical protein
VQRVRQQDIFAASGDVTQFRHRSKEILFSDRKKGMRSCHLSFVWAKITSPLWNLNGYLFFGIHWSYLRSTFERTDKHFKSQLKIICSHGCISKRVMARCYILIFPPYSFFSPEKWVYTQFSPWKYEYILRFPPRKNEYILNFPPGNPSMC